MKLKKMVTNVLLRIKLFFVFLRWCWVFPTDIVENWEDMNTRFKFENDPEITRLLKQIEAQSNK